MKFIRYISVLLLAAAAFAGCLSDRTDGCDPANGQIVIQIKTPESFASRSNTRALTDMQEQEIKTLDILVFEDNGVTETFMYHVVPTHIQSATDPAVQYFTATLQTSKNSEKQRLVLLANIPGSYRSQIGDITEGMEKETALDKLVFSGSSVMTDECLPMWGESDRSVVVTERTTGGAFGTIKMLYSMARIDVGINADDDWTEFLGHDYYKLTEVHLFNINPCGYMAPHRGDLNDGLPTIPAEGNGTKYSQSIAQGVAPDPLPPNGTMHFFYVPEYANKGKTSENLSYLVVKVEYDHPDGMSATESYYRIDFYKRGDAITGIERLDLLRGHLYMVNITGIDGPGYPTLEQAASSVTTLLNAEVTVWNEKGIETGLESGKEEYYKLSVSQANFVFNGMERGAQDTNNKVTILTDYSGGWKVSAITEFDEYGYELLGNGWLRTNVDSGNRDELSAVSLLVQEYDSTTPRRGRIYIEAGKWTYTINVEQRLGTITVSPETIDLKFDHVQVPLAEARLTMDTEFGWMLDRIEYESDSEGWLSVFDPELADPLNIFKKDFDLPEYNVYADPAFRSSRHAHLRADANTTGSMRTATVWFRNEDGIEASVEVRQGWINCGAGGVPKIREVGGKTYDTHIYGTNIRKIGESMIEMGYFKRLSEEVYSNDPLFEKKAIRYIQQIPNESAVSCFMVENSQEGDWTYETFKSDSSVVGPYYETADAESACPQGWRLPNDMDINNIYVLNDAFHFYRMEYLRPDFNPWINSESLTSFMNIPFNAAELSASGDAKNKGYFHANRDGYRNGLLICDSYSYFYTNNYDSTEYWKFYAPVRCVEDVNPYNYPMYDRDDES